jgi:hypothetical protein
MRHRFMTSWLVALAVVGLSAAVSAQGPVTATWNANPEPDIAGYRLIIDSSITDVGNVTTFVTPTLPAGPHKAALIAYNTSGLVSAPSSPPVLFTVVGQTADPCLPPLGAHAPAIFPTSATLTTGRPGSRSFLNYQLGGPDPVVEVAVQIDGTDAAVGKGSDLKAFSGMWFTQPATGTHTLGVRVLTSFGCALVRSAAPLVVK